MRRSELDSQRLDLSDLIQSDRVPHFEEAGRTNPKTSQDLMPEAAYSAALDHLVFTCVDLVFCHHRRVLLAKRNKYPRRSWWVIGGRMVSGESPLDTARRKAFEEAGLENVAGDRFQYIGVYSTAFALREQQPIHHGSHSVNLTYLLQLTDEEQQRIKLTSQEYESDYRWMELEQVFQLANPADALDQSLLQIIQDMRSLLA